jgi:MFS family permease
MTGTGPRASRWTARLGPFGQAPFAVYWTGGFVSNVGTWLQAVAASVFVYTLTGSVFMVGVLNFASYLPIVLFSVYGGTLADRLDRRRIIIVSHVLSGILALMLGLLTVAGMAGAEAVIVVGFLLNTNYALSKPSIIALLSAVVRREDLSEAVSLNTLQFILGQMLGPLIATITLATAGIAPAFLLNAATYLGPIVAMVYLGRHGIGDRRSGTDGSARSTGPPIGVFRFIRGRAWVVAMLAGVVVTSACMEIMRTISPALAVEQLHADDSVTGLLIAAQSLGSAIGVVTFVTLQRRGRAPLVALIALGIQAVGLIGAATSSTVPVAAASGMLVGLGFSLCFPYLTSSLQMGVTDDMRGRVMSVHQVAHLGNRPFTALIAGAIAAVFGIPAALLVGAAVTPLGMILVRRATRLVEGDPEVALAITGDGSDTLPPTPQGRTA